MPTNKFRTLQELQSSSIHSLNPVRQTAHQAILRPIPVKQFRAGTVTRHYLFRIIIDKRLQSPRGSRLMRSAGQAARKRRKQDPSQWVSRIYTKKGGSRNSRHRLGSAQQSSVSLFCFVWKTDQVLMKSAIDVR